MSDPVLPNPDVVCKSCGSSRVLSIRLDSDWAMGGDVTRVNRDSYYESDDPKNGDDRPDIYIYHCLNCGHQEG